MPPSHYHDDASLLPRWHWPPPCRNREYPFPSSWPAGFFLTFSDCFFFLFENFQIFQTFYIYFRFVKDFIRSYACVSTMLGKFHFKWLWKIYNCFYSLSAVLYQKNKKWFDGDYVILQDRLLNINKKHIHLMTQYLIYSENTQNASTCARQNVYMDIIYLCWWTEHNSYHANFLLHF